LEHLEAACSPANSGSQPLQIYQAKWMIDRNSLRACATEFVTAPEWARAAHEHEAGVHGDLRFVAI